MRSLQGFDVVVVGGGWGGLAGGALLARHGLKVLLLEAGQSLGGRASFQERDGFLVDYGIHGHRFGPDGAAARVYRELGEPLDLIEPGPGLVFHHGESYTAPATPIEFARTRLLPLKAKLAAGRALGRLAARNPDKNYRRPVSELIPGRLNPEAKSIISTLCGLGLISPDLSETSAGEFIWFLRKAARSGEILSFPRGGCRQHIRRLGGIIQERGETRCGFRVERLLVEGGAVVGVEGKQGTVRARVVVTAFPLVQVAEILPPGTLGVGLERRIKEIRPTMGLSWDVGLWKPITDVHSVVSTEPLIIGSFNSNFDPALCPRGRQLSTWCRPLPPSIFGEPEKLKRAEEELRSSVFRMFPNCKENIQWERMMRLSVIDGALPAASQAWPSRPAPGDSGVPGLFFAGDTVGVSGQGGDIAFHSGLKCAKAVLSYLD